MAVHCLGCAHKWAMNCPHHGGPGDHGGHQKPTLGKKKSNKNLWLVAGCKADVLYSSAAQYSAVQSKILARAEDDSEALHLVSLRNHSLYSLNLFSFSWYPSSQLLCTMAGHVLSFLSAARNALRSFQFFLYHPRRPHAHRKEKNAPTFEALTMLQQPQHSTVFPVPKSVHHEKG